MVEKYSPEYYAELDVKRAPTMAAAKACLDRGDYDAAEATVKAGDPTENGAWAYAKLLEAHFRALAARQPRPDAATLREAFQRALYGCFSSYPDPHCRTDAEDAEKAAAADTARLVSVLGYDPRT